MGIIREGDLSVKRLFIGTGEIAEINRGSPLFTFYLTEFEEEMLYASFTKERLHDFCIANSLTIKSVYRYREKITTRLGFSHFNETIIFLTRIISCVKTVHR